ncbi:MAG: dihydroorotate dehydrogenase-like protein [Bacteroidota bacterium]|nr:dihydroorotate dehydrogenase-like protein [Bacteroidota bacterium]
MDLSTTYMGLKLKNPIVPSASPLSRELSTIKELEDAGAAAIVIYSLFEEQIEHEALELDYLTTKGTESFAEALTYFPQEHEYHLGPDDYLEHIQKAKKAVNIPIIGSLNGVTSGGWLDYAKKIGQAGADGLELNIYYIPTDSKFSSLDIENIYTDILKEVKGIVKIPVAVKLSPFFSSMANIATKLDDNGADALVLFNRFYQPDIDLEKLDVVPNIFLSTPQAMRLPLRWIAILYGKIKANIAATSGIHNAEDVLKMLMVGSNVTMMCSALLENGPKHITKVLKDMETWMEKYEYESVKQMIGSMSHKSVKEPAAFERANYMRVLNSYK